MIIEIFFLHVIHITFQSEVTKISSIVSYFTQEIGHFDECQVKYNQENTGMNILFNQQVLSGKQMNI